MGVMGLQLDLEILEVLLSRTQNCMSDCMSGHSGDGLRLDLGILLIISNLNGGMIPW